MSPVIIVGPGRSGSSLLNAMLGAHPAIAMLGEFDSSIPMLWRCFWDTSAAAAARSRFNVERFRRIPPSELPNDQSVLDAMAAIERAERDRIAGIVRGAIEDVYRLRDHPDRLWGFKEIWVGSDRLHEWEIYDHIIRQRSSSRSCAIPSSSRAPVPTGTEFP